MAIGCASKLNVGTAIAAAVSLEGSQKRTARAGGSGKTELAPPHAVGRKWFRPSERHAKEHEVVMHDGAVPQWIVSLRTDIFVCRTVVQTLNALQVGVVEGIAAVLLDGADQLIRMAAAREEEYSNVVSQPGKSEILLRVATGIGSDGGDGVTLQRFEARMQNLTE